MNQTHSPVSTIARTPHKAMRLAMPVCTRPLSGSAFSPRTVLCGVLSAGFCLFGAAKANPTVGATITTTAPAAPVAAAAPTAAACPALLQHTFKRLQDEKPQALCQFSGKVLLVVNTASYCGFTGQFEGLEALNAKYAARGLVVLGFPSNDFKQEDADARKTAEVCFNTYGVKFPMFTDTRVKGREAHPLFAELARVTGSQPGWNFNKYLVGRDGKPVAHFGSMTGPDSRKLVSAIEAALAVR